MGIKALPSVPLPPYGSPVSYPKGSIAGSIQDLEGFLKAIHMKDLQASVYG